VFIAYLLIIGVVTLVLIANLFTEKRLVDRLSYGIMLVPFLLRLLQLK